MPLRNTTSTYGTVTKILHWASVLLVLAGWAIGTAAIVIALGTLALVLVAMYWPWLAQHLRFEPLSPAALGMAVVCGGLGWGVNALPKRFF